VDAAVPGADAGGGDAVSDRPAYFHPPEDVLDAAALVEDWLRSEVRRALADREVGVPTWVLVLLERLFTMRVFARPVPSASELLGGDGFLGTLADLGSVPDAPPDGALTPEEIAALTESRGEDSPE
jgi:hypothetical protein